MSVIFMAHCGQFHFRISKCFTHFTGGQVMVRSHTMICSSGNEALIILSPQTKGWKKGNIQLFHVWLSFHLYRNGKTISTYSNGGLCEIDTTCFGLFAEMIEIFCSGCRFLTRLLQTMLFLTLRAQLLNSGKENYCWNIIKFHMVCLPTCIHG